MLVKRLRVAMIARPEIPGVLKFVRKIMDILSDEDVLLEQGLAKKLGKPPATPRALRKADAIVTIGGDGTVLFAQQLAPDVPVLGINLGERGFLAEVKPNEVKPAFEKLRAGKLQIVKRERLAATVRGRRLPDALNDVVVSSASTGKTVRVKVLIGGDEAMDVRGDGVIVATPTGSAAYAHAAGGPLVDPDLEALTVVPICPSFPRPPPLVTPIDSRIVVEPTRPWRDAYVAVDGRPLVRIRYGERVRLHRSKNPALFFKWENFYRKAMERLW
ncbi:MAG TPA: NAD(+)/NADH kinase [Hadesarchaea archaeon]|nr:NAD(+)/NADH kinase [Hadesarchaea archaeon]